MDKHLQYMKIIGFNKSNNSILLLYLFCPGFPLPNLTAFHTIPAFYFSFQSSIAAISTAASIVIIEAIDILYQLLGRLKFGQAITIALFNAILTIFSTVMYRRGKKENKLFYDLTLQIRYESFFLITLELGLILLGIRSSINYYEKSPSISLVANYYSFRI
jgi:hypothetical protein